MSWMNEHDVEDCVALLHEFEQRSGAEYPNLIAGAETLQRLVRWTNRNSDGWPYWKKPSDAAKRLQDHLWNIRRLYIDDQLQDLTEAELKRCYTPIKTFLTKQGADHEAVFPTPPPPPPTYKNPGEPTRVEGRVISVDGQVTEFAIATDATWQQWGNTNDVLGRNSELLGALAIAAAEHLQDDELEDD